MDWLEEVLKHEGGYVNDPTDKGGETNYGISKNAYPDLDIKNLTIEQAKEIYIKDYIKPCKADQLPKHLQFVHFDTAVNMGVSGAARVLQRACSVKVDGIIGPKTIEAAHLITKDRYLLYRAFRYMKFIGNSYNKLKKDPEDLIHCQAKYSNGWVNRLKDITHNGI